MYTNEIKELKTALTEVSKAINEIAERGMEQGWEWWNDEVFMHHQQVFSDLKQKRNDLVLKQKVYEHLFQVEVRISTTIEEALETFDADEHPVSKRVAKRVLGIEMKKIERSIRNIADELPSVTCGAQYGDACKLLARYANDNAELNRVYVELSK